MQPLIEILRSALESGSPVIYVRTLEEQRAVNALRRLVVHHEGGARRAHLWTWDCVAGLDPPLDHESRDPVTALEAITGESHPGIVAFKDIGERLEDPQISRALRNACARLAGSATQVVILSTHLPTSEALARLMWLVELPLPYPDELLEHALVAWASLGRAAPDAAQQAELAASLRGLTLDDVDHVIRRAAAAGSSDLAHQVALAKFALVRRNEVFEHVTERASIDDIGGLSRLKDWARRRVGLLGDHARAAGRPIPRGILLMGVSGCGKSLAAKALSALWNVPLFRLDMNRVYSGGHGRPADAFSRALGAIETAAPAVLWIDEFERALGLTSDATVLDQSLILSSLLTWMQEHRAPVFVAATANRIEALPAELIRRGRFDEIFFCDLPDDGERREILEIHLRRHRAPPDLEIERLIAPTDGWTGAELEQVVIAARIDAETEARPMTQDDLRRHIARTVPLAQAMVEQVRAIRSWAFHRATPASGSAT